MRHPLLSTKIVSLAAAAAASLAPTAARADAVQCRASNGTWNAPKGALVALHTPGVVGSLFQAVGLYWTHSTVSHGTGAMSQATRTSPTLNGKVDQLTNRVFDSNTRALWNGDTSSSLSKGQPGASRVNLGGAYASIYGDCAENPVGNVPGYGEVRCSSGADDVVFYAGDSRTPHVAEFLDGSQRRAVPSGVFPGIGTFGLEQYLFPRTLAAIPGMLPVPLTVEYSFVQFKQIGTNHLGTVSPDGMACSTFLAYAWNRATGAVIQPHTWDKSQVAAGVQALRTATFQKCLAKAHEDGFQSVAENTFNVCGRAADQLANCFVGANDGDKCDNYGDEWQHPSRWRGGDTAVSIAPNTLAENKESPWTPRWGIVRPGRWVNGLYLAPSYGWVAPQPQRVTWSSEGAVYGCWAGGGEAL